MGRKMPTLEEALRLLGREDEAKDDPAPVEPEKLTKAE
jgi:hypothetical protein